MATQESLADLGLETREPDPRVGIATEHEQDAPAAEAALPVVEEHAVVGSSSHGIEAGYRALAPTLSSFRASSAPRAMISIFLRETSHVRVRNPQSGFT